jgi:hypothetical protein
MAQKSRFFEKSSFSLMVTVTETPDDTIGVSSQVLSPSPVEVH